MPTLTDEMIEWFTVVGGETNELKTHDWRGRERITKQVKYGNAKPSYTMQDGSNTVLIRFNGADASTASMFLLKFLQHIDSHNMKEYQDYVR